MRIPEAALQQHIAVLGKNGSGKTYATKAVIVEPLLAAQKHVAIVDPTSAWWGLRSSADGKGPGYKIVVLGGEHGDLPLPPLGGAAVARLAIEQRVNIIADTGNLTVGERTRWMIDFAGTIYRLNRSPLHLVLDEAHVFAPQGKVPDPDTGKMLHAVNQLASGGRSRGIRLTMITQRPQKLHKDSLTTADTLIAMRVLAPHDREAVKAWIDGCGDPAQGKQVLDSLAGLQRGEGWIWYPEGAHLTRSKFPAIKTFDSSATPTDGGALKAPKGAAEIDLTEIRAALADAVREAEANDPKLLRAEIARLKREIGQPKELAVDTEALHREYRRGKIEGYREGIKAFEGTARRVRDLDNQLESFREDVRALSVDIQQWVESEPDPAVARTPSAEKIIPKIIPANRVNGSGNKFDTGLPVGERSILIACAQHLGGVPRDSLTVMTGYKRSTRNAYIQRLAEKGFVTANGNDINVTDAGIAALGSDYEPLPSGQALRDYWIDRLPEGERLIFETVLNVYPKAVDREEVSRLTGYKRSTRNAYIQRLAARLLVRSLGDQIAASEDLFA